MSPGGSDSGAFGLTPPLVVVDDFVAEDVTAELAADCEPAAELDVVLFDEPQPAIAAATPTASRAGTVRIRPPSGRGLIAGDASQSRVIGGYAQVIVRSKRACRIPSG